MGEFLRVTGYIFLGLLSFLILIILYGVFIEPRFIIDVTRTAARIPNLPEEWEGREIAVIADLQVGMWFANIGAIRKAVSKIVKDPPAAALVLGDFIYHASDHTDQVVRQAQDLLAPLVKAGIPVYGVLGNHDYRVVDSADPSMNYSRALETRDALRAIGIRMVENAAVQLAPAHSEHGCPLYLVGIGSYMAHDSEPEEAFAQVPEAAPRFVFMHNPDSFKDIPAGKAPAAVAGHTHGGQIRIPGFPDWSYLSIFEEGQVHIDGWIVDDFGQPGNHLYVNRGIGFSDYPIRINCPPEVTRFRLTAKAR